MIKRKRKRNPLKDDKKLMRKVAEFLAKAIEKEPDGITAYLLAAELIRRDSIYCEECQSFDIEKGCDWSICYPEIYELLEDSTLESAKEAAEDLAEDLRIVDYVKVFRYHSQMIKYDHRHGNKPTIQLLNINLSKLDLSNLDLCGANLSGANLSGANLFKTDLSRTKLFKADLSRSELTGMELTYADLHETNLTQSTLIEADLRGSNLTDSDLSGANLSGANLSGANLSGANLSGANLSGAKFKYARLSKSTNFEQAFKINEAINLILPNPRKVFLYDKKKKSTIITKRNRK